MKSLYFNFPKRVFICRWEPPFVCVGSMQFLFFFFIIMLNWIWLNRWDIPLHSLRIFFNYEWIYSKPNVVYLLIVLTFFIAEYSIFEYQMLWKKCALHIFFLIHLDFCWGWMFLFFGPFSHNKKNILYRDRLHIRKKSSFIVDW